MTLLIAALVINGLGYHWLWNFVAVVVWCGHVWFYDERLTSEIVNKINLLLLSRGK